MRRLYYSASAVVATIALPIVANAGAICDSISHCGTYSCLVRAFADCIGGSIVDSTGAIISLLNYIGL
jgi:hypothetical protein